MLRCPSQLKLGERFVDIIVVTFVVVLVGITQEKSFDRTVPLGHDVQLTAVPLQLSQLVSQ